MSGEIPRAERGKNSLGKLKASENEQ